MTTAPTDAMEPATSGVGGETGGLGDRVFFSATSIAGVIMVVTIVAIGVFLLNQALPALRHDTTNPLTTKAFDPEGSPASWGIAVLAFGTLLTSFLAILMAVPIALGVALFVTQFAPRRIAGLLGGIVDLLAAVPSVVYGLWGVAFLNVHLQSVNAWLHDNLGWFPLFGDSGGLYSKSILLAAIVLAIMVLPIVAALSREVLLQVPESLVEGALALGATRWEAVRTAVLPPSRAGIVSAIMLGLGRALGETIAVALVLGFSPAITWHILGPGGNTIAANIATTFGEYASAGRGALIATGLVLFVITFVVNAAARAVVIRATNKRLA